MLEIDGSYGEGGGQILRYGLALSVMTKRPFRIYNIRARRKKPGLMPQHLTSIRAAAKISGAEVRGDHYGSTDIQFIPGEIKPGSYSFDVAEERSSAGSVSLVLQSVVPVLILANEESQIVVKGGTHVPFAPIFDYWNLIFAEMLKRFGIDLFGRIISHGFYPKGGGEIFVRVKSQRPRPIDLIDRGRLIKISVISAVSNLSKNIAERQVSPVREKITDLDVDVRVISSVGAGTYILIRAEYENVVAGFSALGRKGRPAEKVGNECLGQFLKFHNSKGVIDRHLSDQILIYLLMAKGRSRFIPPVITSHLKTGIWIIDQFLDGAATIKNESVEISGTVL